MSTYKIPWSAHLPVTLSSCSNYLCVDRLTKTGLNYLLSILSDGPAWRTVIRHLFSNQTKATKKKSCSYHFVLFWFPTFFGKVLKKSECLIYKMLIIEECKPSLNMQGDSAHAKSFNGMPKNVYYVLHLFKSLCHLDIFIFALKWCPRHQNTENCNFNISPVPLVH